MCCCKPRSTKDCGPLPEPGRERETQQILRVSKGTKPVRQLEFEFLAFRIVRELTYVVLSHQMCDFLLKQPLKSTTTPNNRLEHTKTASWAHLHLHLAIISVINKNRKQRRVPKPFTLRCEHSSYNERSWGSTCLHYT